MIYNAFCLITVLYANLFHLTFPGSICESYVQDNRPDGFTASLTVHSHHLDGVCMNFLTDMPHTVMVSGENGNIFFGYLYKVVCSLLIVKV